MNKSPFNYHHKYFNELFSLREIQPLKYRRIFGAGQSCLSFYPIAKNLRFIASDVAQNSLSGRSTVISEQPRIGEEEFCRSKLGWSDWKPWVWMPGAKSNKQAILEILCNNRWDSIAVVNQRRITTNTLIPECLPKLVDHISALAAIFKPSSRILDSINQSCPSLENLKKSIGVHIRRGDIQSRDGTWNRPDRHDQFGIEVYAKACREAAEMTGIGSVFVISDSDDAAEKLQDQLPDLSVFQNQIDRSKFFRQKHRQSIDLEEQVRNSPELADFYVTATVIDLFAIAKCKGFVGPLGSSEMARTAYYLQLANSSCYKPYVSVGEEFGIHSSNFAQLK